jgi:uncharacterized protein YaaQ
MKLMVCIIEKKYSSRLVQKLGENGYRVTKLASTGGFLKQGNETLLIGVGNEQIPSLQLEMKEAVQQIEMEKGWSATSNRYTSFVVNGHNFLNLKNLK